jgi:hypothetical protein
MRFMRALTPIAVVLVAALAAPSASAQGGGVTAPQSGGAPAPDPAPERSAPEPDAAPGADSVEAAPPPQPSPAPTAPSETSAPLITPEPATSRPSAVPQGGQSARRTRRDRAARYELRKERKARQHHRRSTAGRPSPTSVFGLNVALVGAAGTDAQTESPPVELIALALLTLVFAAAASLVLTARVSRMEGLLAPIRPDAGRLRRGLQTSRFSPRAMRRRPVS